MSYGTGQRERVVGAHGAAKFVASRQASQMFLCWLEEAIVRRVVTLPSKARFSFQEARSAGNCDWIGSGRMAIDGLKVQEAVMLIEAGLSTYEKAQNAARRWEILPSRSVKRCAAGSARGIESGLRQSTEEESDSRAA
ncbi:hypothetical protein ECZU34_00170 [Escherichia coli]|nr:hypothetical protein ECZU34_00170 [Escherichia coli]